MDDIGFASLLNFVGVKIEKRYTKITEFVSAEKRLVATLRHLATGKNYKGINLSISLQPLGQLIPQMCLQI